MLIFIETELLKYSQLFIPYKLILNFLLKNKHYIKGSIFSTNSLNRGKENSISPYPFASK